MQSQLNISAKVKTVLSILVCALFFSAHLKAQETGSITGTVVDAETGETLIGVHILVESTGKGAATNLDGQYQISGLAAGTYTVIVSYISFQKLSISNVQVLPGTELRLDIALKPETELLEDVVITAGAILSSEAGLLLNRKKSISFNDAISAEMISQTGSGNAADAMTKVTGASVVDGKYVYIRGLGNRYSSTHLNGAELPSADPEKKSFQLDLFPSGLLENLVTVKTFTPDRPGNFSGGIVDISTVSFPEKTTLEVSASTTYNTQFTSETALFDARTATDWLARGTKRRLIPTIFNTPGVSAPSQQSARRNAEQAQLLSSLSNSFDANMIPEERAIPISQGYSVAFGTLSQLFGKDLGVASSFSYSQNFSAINGVNGTYSLIGNVAGTDSLHATQLLADQRGQEEVNWGGMASFSYKLHQNHHLSAKYLRTQSGISQGRFLEGYWTELGSATYQSRVSSYSERGLHTWQLEGEHQFPSLFNLTVEWRGMQAENNQYEPDMKYFTNRVSYMPNLGQMVYSDLGGNNPPPTRYFRFLDEQNKSFNVDVSFPFKIWSRSGNEVKFGGSYLTTEREFRQRRFDYERGNGFRLLDYTLEHGPDFNGYFAQAGIIGVADNGQYLFGNLIREAYSEKSNYDGMQHTQAAYAMLQLNLTRNLRLVGGARLENTRIEMISFDEDQPKGELNNLDLLPSLNLLYNFGENKSLRLAYTHTVARPTFRELAPYSTFSFRGDYVFQGNSQLRRTRIKNYDARWEWFPQAGEIFSVSAFYKHFVDPLERVIRADMGSKAASIQNVDHAIVYGVEFEARKRLDDIMPALRNFEIGANLALVYSEVEIPESELIEIRQSDPNPKTTRQLQGQSPYVYNLILTYANLHDVGLIASASLNRFGDRLSGVARGATPNLFERGYGTLDFTLSKHIGKHFSVNASAKNILDPEIKTSQRFKEAEFINESYKKGRSFSLGVKYSF